jgi:hypothetical protein
VENRSPDKRVGSGDWFGSFFVRAKKLRIANLFSGAALCRKRAPTRSHFFSDCACSRRFDVVLLTKKSLFRRTSKMSHARRANKPSFFE